MNNYKPIGTELKKLRVQRKISQRGLAEKGILSFAQIQRIEKGTRDIYVQKMSALLDLFDYTWKVEPKEPHWQRLIKFGLPLRVEGQRHILRWNRESEIIKEVLLASRFLYFYRFNTTYGRHIEAFEGLLFALSSHFPTFYKKIDQQAGHDLGKRWRPKGHLDARHLKMRSLALDILLLHRQLPYS